MHLVMFHDLRRLEMRESLRGAKNCTQNVFSNMDYVETHVTAVYRPLLMTYTSLAHM
jgi:hypothetical protein